MDTDADLEWPPDAVVADLARFEARLRADFETDGIAAQPMLGLIEAGGKRLRPGLILLCAHLGELDFEKVVSAAVAVELTHAATLVHDDVIDRSAMRRGRPTVAVSHGRPEAIVIADYYFAKSYLRASATGEPEVVATLARAVMDVCEGELRQQASRQRYWFPINDYLERIRLKTATLIAASCEVGALLGGLRPSQRQALARYGTGLGVAFQVADDVLDYVATEAELGKPVGHDLLEGYGTLPLLLAQTEEAVRPQLQELLKEGRSLTVEQVLEVVDIVRSTEAPARALAHARDQAQAAVAELGALPPGPARSALEGLADYVVSRKL